MERELTCSSESDEVYMVFCTLWQYRQDSSVEKVSKDLELSTVHTVCIYTS